GLDHRRILATAIARLRAKLKYRPVIFELMPPEFTLTELQTTVEAISGRHLHKQNFRRLVETGAMVEPTGETSTATGGRPAALFRFRREVVQERPAPGLRVGGRGQGWSSGQPIDCMRNRDDGGERHEPPDKKSPEPERLIGDRRAELHPRAQETRQEIDEPHCDRRAQPGAAHHSTENLQSLVEAQPRISRNGDESAKWDEWQPGEDATRRVRDRQKSDGGKEYDQSQRKQSYLQLAPPDCRCDPADAVGARRRRSLDV